VFSRVENVQQREAQKLDQTDNIQVIYDYYKKYQKRLDIANLEEEEREWQQENTSSGGMPKLYYSYFLWFFVFLFFFQSVSGFSSYSSLQPQTTVCCHCC
jgi:hypothetical protein